MIDFPGHGLSSPLHLGMPYNVDTYIGTVQRVVQSKRWCWGLGNCVWFSVRTDLGIALQFCFFFIFPYYFVLKASFLLLTIETNTGGVHLTVLHLLVSPHGLYLNKTVNRSVYKRCCLLWSRIKWYCSRWRVGFTVEWKRGNLWRKYDSRTYKYLLISAQMLKQLWESWTRWEITQLQEENDHLRNKMYQWANLLAYRFYKQEQHKRKLLILTNWVPKTPLILASMLGRCAAWSERRSRNISWIIWRTMGMYVIWPIPQKIRNKQTPVNVSFVSSKKSSSRTKRSSKPRKDKINYIPM